MLKITKDGHVKVVQKRLQKITKDNRKTLNQTKQVASKEAINAKPTNENLIRHLFIKSMNNKSNRHLKAVLNSTLKKQWSEQGSVNYRATSRDTLSTQPVSVIKNPAKRKIKDKLVSNSKHEKTETTLVEFYAKNVLKRFRVRVKPKKSPCKQATNSLKNQTTLDNLFHISKSPNSNISTAMFLNDTTKKSNDNVNFNNFNSKKLKQATLFDVFKNKSTANSNSSVNGKTKYIKSERHKKLQNRKKRSKSNLLPVINIHTKDRNNSEKGCTNILDSDGKSSNSSRNYNNNSVSPPLFMTEIKDLFSETQRKAVLNQKDVNSIFVCETNIIKINKCVDTSHHRMSSTDLLSDLFVTMDFPCNKLNSLMFPNYVKFTTFPLSEGLFNKIVSSCIKIEIKKHVLPNRNDYYQFFIFKSDLPVLKIGVCLNCEDQDGSDEVRDFPVNYRCLNDTSEINGSIMKNLSPLKDFDVNSLHSSGLERRVCYSFDNDHILGDHKPNDESSFFIMPSLMYFNSMVVDSDKTCLQLVLKVKISKSCIMPKSCIFKINQNDLNLSGSSLDLNTSCNNSVSASLGCESNSKELLNGANKRSNILNEIQNNIPNTRSGKSYSLNKVNGLLDNAKDNNIQHTNAIANSDVGLLTIIRKQNLKRKAILRTGMQIKRKYKKTKSCKMKDVKNVARENPVDLTAIKSTDDVIDIYGVGFEKNVTTEGCKTGNEEDNRLFNYIKNVDINYITMVTGNSFKPSLLERMINSFKK